MIKDRVCISRQFSTCIPARLPSTTKDEIFVFQQDLRNSTPFRHSGNTIPAQDLGSNSGSLSSGHSNSGRSNSDLPNSGLSSSGHSNSGHSNSDLPSSGLLNSSLSNSDLPNSGHSNSSLSNSGLLTSYSFFSPDFSI